MQAGLYDTHMMLLQRYWALVLGTRSLLSDNHKGERRLDGCPARMLNVQQSPFTHHITHSEGMQASLILHNFHVCVYILKTICLKLTSILSSHLDIVFSTI